MSATQSTRFRFIDLFAGIGGFHHALSSPEFGGECVFASEVDPTCQEVYRRTWPEMADRLVGDIREITFREDGSDRSDPEIDTLIPDHEVLCAGFPCQPFSKSGFQLGELDAVRGTLFHDIVKIARAKKPRFLILENVRNLAGPRHEQTWETIVSTLRGIGYQVSETPVVFSPHLLPPEMEGRPQVRDRVFILATRLSEKHSVSDLEQEPLVTKAPQGGWNPHLWNIEDYLQNDSEVEHIERYRLRPEEEAWINAWQSFTQGIAADDLPGFPIWVDAFKPRPDREPDTPTWKQNFLDKNSAFYNDNRLFIRSWLKESWLPDRKYTVRDFPTSRRKFEWQARTAQPRRADRDLWKLTLHLRPSGIRVKPATYLPALVAITQTSIIGSRARRITPIEAGRLQGFPDSVFDTPDLDDAAAYKQVGNAVNVGAVKFVASCLFQSAGESWGADECKGKLHSPSTPLTSNQKQVA